MSRWERQRIERYLREKRSIRFIAAKLGRSLSSISDEIKLNGISGIYGADKADHKAYVRRKYSKLQCLKVAMDKGLRNFVVENVLEDQSPEGISGRLKEVEKKLPYASFKAIYKFIRSPHGRLIEKHLYSKSVRKKGGPKHKKPVTIDGRIMIDKRPKKVEKRREFGHFEADFIESGKDGKGSFLVLVERKSRYPFLKYLDKRDTQTVNRTVGELLAEVPVKTLTIDNDLSFQKHERLSEIIGADIFFCHPQNPQEKPTVENRNKAIRRYLTKRSDLSEFSLEYIKEVESKLRNKFMSCLNFKTPKEVWDEQIKNKKTTSMWYDAKEKLTLVGCSD